MRKKEFHSFSRIAIIHSYNTFFDFVQQKMLWLIIASLFIFKPLIVHSTNTEKCDPMKLELVQVVSVKRKKD